MRACVMALFFMSILKLNLCRLRPGILASGEDVSAVEIPFGQAKVKYHRSRYCITGFGQTHCVRMNEEPADPAKIARLYKVWMSGFKPKFKSPLKKSTVGKLQEKKKKNQGGKLVDFEYLEMD